MKTIVYSSLLVYGSLLLPIALAAQPTITNNEFYHIGDIFQFVNCNFTGDSAGPSGASQVWDFSALSPTGSFSYLRATADTSSVFVTSNVLITTADGLKEHVQENSTDSYVNGILDTVTNTLAYYTYYDASKRPFTYLSTFADTYRVDIPPTFTTGLGSLMITGDGYGTLKLPDGIYNNVLRIRKYQNETDTTGSPSYVVYTTTISYLWFDNIHSAPLFEIDSVTGVPAGSYVKARYLASASGIENINAQTNNYTAVFDNYGLLVRGFDNGKAYKLTMYNLSGEKVLSEKFVAPGPQQHFYTGQLAAGMYIVSIVQDDDAVNDVIKVVNE